MDTVPTLTDWQWPDTGGPTDARLDDEALWERFRATFFPTDRLNLNPGTLGTPSRLVQEAMGRLQADEMHAFPLGQYVRGREVLRRLRGLASQLWGHDISRMAFCGGTTQTMNLVAQGLIYRLRLADAKALEFAGRPIRVLTSQHEHYGGVAGFERHPGFEVIYASEEDLWDQDAFARLVDHTQPEILFLSQVTYTLGKVLPLEPCFETARATCPGIWCIADAAQAVGLITPAYAHADLTVASAHKWLFGPNGAGFLWLSERAATELRAFHWAGEPLDPTAQVSLFEVAGGQDFALYAGVEAAIEMVLAVTPEVIQQRSARLAAHLAEELARCFKRHQVAVRFSQPFSSDMSVAPPSSRALLGGLSLSFPDFDPYPIYASLNTHGIHVKCIKGRLKLGGTHNLLRFGVPFFETRQRLETVLEVVDAYLSNRATA